MISSKIFKNMKTYKLLFFLIISMLICSCSCSMKMTVSGNPGTEIYKPNGEKLATISTNGQAKVKLECKSYYGYLISKDSNTGKSIPFALDWKKCNRHDITLAWVTALPTIYVGEFVFLFRGFQMAHEYKYKYLPEQRTNEDLQTSNLISPQPIKVLGNE